MRFKRKEDHHWFQVRPWLWVSKAGRRYRLHCDVCHSDDGQGATMVVWSRFRGRFSVILKAHRRCGVIDEHSTD